MVTQQRVPPGKTESVMTVYPVEGTILVYKNFSMTVTFGKQMRDLYDEVSSSTATLSGLKKIIAIMESVDDAFPKPHKDRNKTIDDAIEQRRGSCLDEALAGYLILDRKEDGTMKKEHCLSYGTIMSIEKSIFPGRYKVELNSHEWVEGGGLLLDFGMGKVGIPVNFLNGNVMMFCDEKDNNTLECHRKIYGQLNTEIKKDEDGWKKIKRGDIEGADGYREIFRCHQRIHNSLVNITLDTYRKRKEKLLMPLTYHREKRDVKMPQPE